MGFEGDPGIHSGLQSEVDSACALDFALVCGMDFEMGSGIDPEIDHGVYLQFMWMLQLIMGSWNGFYSGIWGRSCNSSWNVFKIQT